MVLFNAIEMNEKKEKLHCTGCRTEVPGSSLWLEVTSDPRDIIQLIETSHNILLWTLTSLNQQNKVLKRLYEQYRVLANETLPQK